MASRNRVVLAGCGNMGFAMLQGWLAAGRLEPSDVDVVEPVDALRERAASAGVNAVASVPELGAGEPPTLIIVAVKPQVIGAVLPQYSQFALAGSTIVSVAAGIGTQALQRGLGGEHPVIRVMPNTPAAVGAGMNVIYAGPGVDAEVVAFARDLMAASGQVAVIEDESLMDAVTAVSGSGPAYLFHMIEALTAAARNAGLPDDLAATLASQTIYGAAVYAHKSGVEPGTLREQVTSPNGTTAAALQVLMENDRLTRLMTEAVDAARKRSIELGG
ncbi:pyrroline-5-carboxylate reductase [Oricola sp.]|uniref:pyrroline-5-carboxylate reductase n=1 Tax=Oricola sp. TaxID=1979950 RepID=UPI003BAB6508